VAPDGPAMGGVSDLGAAEEVGRCGISIPLHVSSFLMSFYRYISQFYFIFRFYTSFHPYPSVTAFQYLL
jgi:hypothetical protein